LYSLIRVAYFLYGALVVTLRTCYGALQIVVLLLLLLLSQPQGITAQWLVPNYTVTEAYVC